MFRKTIPAVVAAVALGAGLLTVGVQADATSNVGTATVAEAAKVQKEMFKQSCLTPKEVAKIVHGNGDLSEEDSGWEMYYQGAKGSRVGDLYVIFGKDRCADWLNVTKR